MGDKGESKLKMEGQAPAPLILPWYCNMDSETEGQKKQMTSVRRTLKMKTRSFYHEQGPLNSTVTVPRLIFFDI